MAKLKKIRPLHDRVVVKRTKAEDKIGNIVLPDEARQKPQTGEVLAVGPGSMSRETGNRTTVCVEVGDTVLFMKYAGTESTELGDDVLILGESEILGVIE